MSRRPKPMVGSSAAVKRLPIWGGCRCHAWELDLKVGSFPKMRHIHSSCKPEMEGHMASGQRRLVNSINDP